MLDVLIFVAGTALWLYGLIDCAKTEQDSVRILPKWAWLIIIIIFGSFGALAVFQVGHILKQRHAYIHAPRRHLFANVEMPRLLNA